MIPTGLLSRKVLKYRTFSGCSFVRGDQGAAIIEFALMMAILFPALIFGTVEMGSLAYASIELADSAQAGASYAEASFRQSNGWPGSTYPGDLAVQSAAVAAAPNTTLTTSGVTVGCSCTANGTDLTCNTVTLSSCGSGILYVTVKTQATVSPIIKLPNIGIATSRTMYGQATFELDP